jgi:hypothetical protein
MNVPRLPSPRLISMLIRPADNGSIGGHPYPSIPPPAMPSGDIFSIKAQGNSARSQ